MLNATKRAFQYRILNEFLPAFCSDPSQCLDTAGFKEDWHRVSDVDAGDFLRGIDGGFRKLQALRFRRPPLFWAVGPERSGSAFRKGYSEEGITTFDRIEDCELAYHLTPFFK